MADLGLVWEDVAEDYEFEVYSDNYDSVIAFMNLSTQWRVGPGGIVGLDYNVIPFVFEMMGFDKKDYPDFFNNMRIMECASLSYIRDLQKIEDA